MINPNSWYIAMHLDRLNEELITEMYGKQDEEEVQKKKRKAKLSVENDTPEDKKET